MKKEDALPGFLENYLQQQPGVASEVAPSEELRPGEWRGVWTWIERADGEGLPASLELLGRGREIAEELGTRNCAVLAGNGLAQAAARLGEFGADRVYVLESEDGADFSFERTRTALGNLVRDRRPEILLFPATIQGRNLAAQASMDLGTGIVPNCNALTLDATERLLIGHQTSFEQRLLSDVACPVERPQIFTLTPGSYRRPAPEAGRRASVVTVGPPPKPAPSRVQIVAAAPEPAKTLEQYDALVVGGLGLASRHGFELALQLAQELQAYAGATRGAVACGWADADRLISVARHRLHPRLYLACGVVGEYDHLKAIEGADFVLALTPSAAAPIVENADLVGIGDPAELLRRLVDHLRRAKKDRVTLP